MKWVESETKRDHWEFSKEDLAEFDGRTVDELKETIKITDGVIKNQETSMQRRFPDSLHYFLRMGELFTYERPPGGLLTDKIIKIDHKQLVHNRFTSNSKPIKGIIYPEGIPYTKEEIQDIKDGIIWLNKKRVWRRMLDIAIMKRLFGDEYFKNEESDYFDKIENIFSSLTSVKSITRLYLYAVHIKKKKNISYVDALRDAIALINFPTNKDIIDLENSFKTWRKDNPELVDQVLGLTE